MQTRTEQKAQYEKDDPRTIQDHRLKELEALTAIEIIKLTSEIESFNEALRTFGFNECADCEQLLEQYNIGYDSGRDEGEEEGLREGYQNGKEDGESQIIDAITGDRQTLTLALNKIAEMLNQITDLHISKLSEKQKAEVSKYFLELSKKFSNTEEGSQ